MPDDDNEKNQPNETDSDPASEPAEEAEKPDEAKAKNEPRDLKSQIKGMLMLLLVFGGLWVLVMVLPKFGDWLGENLSSMIGDKPASETEVADDAELEKEPAEKPDVSKPKTLAKNSETPTPPASTDPIPGDSVRAQIVEQLGGADRCKVKYYSFYDDGEKLVTSLKITTEAGTTNLVELIFERNEKNIFESVEGQLFDDIVIAPNYQP